MALDDIRPAGQRALRWHGACLAAWALTVGVVVDLVLLHVLQVHAMALRYAAGAGSMYFFGFLLGGWWYARWCAARDRRTDDFLQHATPEERRAAASARKKPDDKSGWMDTLPDLGGWGDDPISAILALAALVLALVALALLVTWLPVLAMDMLAGYLAEIVLEFVIGASIYRHIKKPQPLGVYWGVMVRRTWLAGVLAIVVAGAAGHAVQRVAPDARTLGQALGVGR